MEPHEQKPPADEGRLQRRVRPLPGGLRLTVTERCELDDWRHACEADAVAAERERWADAVRALMCSDVGVQTRHKLEAGQGTNTADGKAWLRALQMLSDGPNVY